MAKLFAEIIGKFDGNSIKRGLQQTQKDVASFNRAAPRMGRALGGFGAAGGLGGLGAGISAGLGGLAANQSLTSTREAQISAAGMPDVSGAQAHAIQRLDEENFLGGQVLSTLQTLTEMQRAAARGDAQALHIATGGEYQGKNVFELFRRAVEKWDDLSEYERRMTGLNLYDERLRRLGPGVAGATPTPEFAQLREMDKYISEGRKKFERATDIVTATAGHAGAWVVDMLDKLGQVTGAQSIFSDYVGAGRAISEGALEDHKRIQEMEKELYDRKAAREKTNDLLRSIDGKLDQ